MANLRIHLVIWLAATVALLACTSDALFWGRRLCRYNGRYYRPGNTFPARDGCNRCVCMKYGTVVCTRKACIPNPVCPKPTGFGICVELCSRDEDCFAGQKCCSNGCGHVCTTIQNCAVISCLIPDCPSGVIAPPPPGLCCPTCGCNTTDGNVVRVGESFPAGDGCNTCSCTDSGPRCTLRPCIGCKLDNGTVVPAGTSFPASDGCNTCTCQQNGQIACTEKACLKEYFNPPEPVY